jgi:hypothetical protein
LEKNEEDHLYFTFPLEGRSYERPLNSLFIKEIKVNQSKRIASFLKFILDSNSTS